MVRRIVVSVVLIGVVLAGAGLGFKRLLENRVVAPGVEVTSRPLRVDTLTVRPETVVERLLGFGTAAAERHAWVSSEVDGEVVELPDAIKVGAAVEAGQLLVQIDDRDRVQQVARAEALLAADTALLEQLDREEENLQRLRVIAQRELDVAQREYQRVKGLFEAGNSNQREYDLAQLAFEQARRVLQQLENQAALLPDRRKQQAAAQATRTAELELARLTLSRCRIVSPFAGRIEAVRVERGERVQPRVPLIAVLDPDRVEVAVELPMSARPSVAEGAGCQLCLESRLDVCWSGKVARVAPSADASMRTFAVYVEVDNRRQQRALVPGMFVRAEIDGLTLADTLVVPRAALTDDRVFVLEGDRARERRVQVIRVLLDRVAVGGLRAGERIITTNLDVMTDGAQVAVAEAGEPASPGPAAAGAAAPAGKPSPQ